MTNVYARGTLEYLTCTLADTGGDDLTTDTVEISIHRGPPATWLPAQWISGTEVRTVEPVSFDAGTYPSFSYSVSLRVLHDPEVPIVRVGDLTITG